MYLLKLEYKELKHTLVLAAKSFLFIESVFSAIQFFRAILCGISIPETWLKFTTIESG